MSIPESMATDAPLIDLHPVRLRACRHGHMLYLTTDRYIGRSLDLYGEFSQGETEVLCQLLGPGQTVLDVGAHIGSQTLPLAKAVGPQGVVHAFEPQRFIFQLLDANIALNALSNVRSQRVALGRQAGTIVVPELDPSVEENFGGLSLLDGGEGLELPMLAIDDLSLDACHLIKIDVEGMENEVLAGARWTIQRFRSHLYVENDREDHSDDLTSHLFDLGYRLFWHLPPLFNPQNFRHHETNVFGSLVSANLLCIHRTRPCVVHGLNELKGS